MTRGANSVLALLFVVTHGVRAQDECLTPANSAICTAMMQTCNDPNTALPSDWVCMCNAPATGTPAQGAPATCINNECAIAANAAVCPTGQTCSDPNTGVANLNDWTCTCNAPTTGAPATGAATTCDECTDPVKSAVCPTGQTCSDTGSMALNDWTCTCDAPSTGAAVTAAPAVCVTDVDECTDPAKSGVCPAGQTCADPNRAVLADWTCTCDAPSTGAPTVAAPATCVAPTGECLVAANAAVCGAGQACVDPNAAPASTGDWQCTCIAPNVGVPVTGAAATCAAPGALLPAKDLVRTKIGLSTLYGILTNPALDGRALDRLGSGGPFTVFAPSDAAWDLLPQGVKQYLNTNPGVMQTLLDYQTVVGNAYTKEQLPAASPVITSDGSVMSVVLELGTVYIPVQGGTERAAVTETLMASNGLIHVIDKVVLPPSVVLPDKSITENVEAINELSTTLEMMKATGLYAFFQQALPSADGVYTFYAPTNKAWEDLPAGQLQVLRSDVRTLEKLMKYYVVRQYKTEQNMRQSPGIVETLNVPDMLAYRVDVSGRLIIKAPPMLDSDGSPLTQTDIKATNGLVHVHSRIVVPNGIVLPQPTLWAIVQATPSLSKIAELLEKGGYRPLLDAKAGPFTLFAPTNAAVAALPTGVFGLAMSDATVREKVLGFLVVEKRVGSQSLLAESPMATREGSSLVATQIMSSATPPGSPAAEVSVDNAARERIGGLAAEAAKVATADLTAANGVAHAVDGFPLPALDRLPVALSGLRGTADSLEVLEPLQLFLLALKKTPALHARLSSGRGPYTIFVPRNEAVERSGGVWSALVADDALRERLLRAHIVEGYYTHADLLAAAPGSLTTLDDGTPLAGRSALALAASTVQLSLDSAGGVTLNGGQAAPVDAATPTANGIVHVTSGVLTPQGLSAQVSSSQAQSIGEVLEANAALKSLAAAVATAGMTANLKSGGPFTLLAPSEVAFAKLAVGERQYILTRADVASEMVKSHVLRDAAVAAANLPAVSPLTSWQGIRIDANQVVTGGKSDIIVNGVSLISQRDLAASNGVIHVVEAIVMDRATGWARTLPTLSLYDMLVQGRDTRKFLSIVNSCGVDCQGLLRGTSGANGVGSPPPAEGLTLFAPTDQGVGLWTDRSYEDALVNAAKAKAIVLGHAVAGYVVPATLARDLGPGKLSKSYVTVGGAAFVTLTKAGDTGMEVTEPAAGLAAWNQPATNGVLHATDRPLSGASGKAGGVAMVDSDDDAFLPWWGVLLIVLGVLCCLLGVGALVYVLVVQPKKKAADAADEEAGSDRGVGDGARDEGGLEKTEGHGGAEGADRAGMASASPAEFPFGVTEQNPLSEMWPSPLKEQVVEMPSDASDASPQMTCVTEDDVAASERRRRSAASPEEAHAARSETALAFQGRAQPSGAE